METKLVKIVVYVPSAHVEKVRGALALSGAGKMGNYDSCSFSVKGTGRFRALKGADPYIGEVGAIEEVEEERIETICARAEVAKVVEAVRAAHPYEEPAIEVYELLDYWDIFVIHKVYSPLSGNNFLEMKWLSRAKKPQQISARADAKNHIHLQLSKAETWDFREIN